jgi:hypothetical protein
MGVGLQKTNTEREREREREREMSPAKIGKHKNARADPRRE